MASTKPMFVAFFLSPSASFPAAMEIKIILSIPKTISKKEKLFSKHYGIQTSITWFIANYYMAIINNW